VARKPILMAIPKVRGIAKVGRLVRCDRGRWDGAGHFTYGWTRDSRPLKAKKFAYRLVAADRGHLIRCVVTAVNKQGTKSALTPAVRVR
jgi:hypothetical protein